MKRGHKRARELDCIYAISDLAGNLEASLDEIFKDIADRVPPGFQRPASICVRVTVFNGCIPCLYSRISASES